MDVAVGLVKSREDRDCMICNSFHVPDSVIIQ